MSKTKKMLKQLFEEKRKFNRFEAAYYITKQGLDTLKNLAETWQWSKSAVRRFLVELEKGGILKKTDDGFAVIREQKIERIEVVEQQLPLFQTHVPPRIEGVPLTKEQLKGPETLIDLKKVNWQEGEKTPFLLFYKLYLEHNPAYVQQESDVAALKRIENHLAKIVRDDMRKRKLENARFNRQMLMAVRKVNETIAQTFYGGYDLAWIAGHWNQVMAACKKIKVNG